MGLHLGPAGPVRSIAVAVSQPFALEVHTSTACQPKKAPALVQDLLKVGPAARVNGFGATGFGAPVLLHVGMLGAGHAAMHVVQSSHLPVAWHAAPWEGVGDHAPLGMQA